MKANHLGLIAVATLMALTAIGAWAVEGDGHFERETSTLIGPVSDISSEERTLVILGVTVRLPEDAFIFDDGVGMTLGEMPQAAFAEARGEWTGSELIARHVSLIPPGPSAVEGTLFEVDMDQGRLRIDGVTVQLMPGTPILGPHGEPIEPGQCRVGGRASAVGEWAPMEELLLAHEVRCQIEDGVHMTRGPIQEINPDPPVVVVNDLRLRVTPETEIVGPMGDPLEFGELAVGDVVHVAFTESSAEGLVALFIAVLPEPIEPMFTEGQIQALVLEPPLVVVNDLRLRVNPETEILGPMGHPIRFEDLGVGDVVAAAYVEAEPDVLVALFIHVLPDGGPHVTRGLIQHISEDPPAIVVHDRAFLVRPETGITGPDGTPLEFGDLMVGDLVHVAFHQVEPGVFVALHIEVHTPDIESHLDGDIQAVNFETGRLRIMGVPVQLTEFTRIHIEDDGNDVVPLTLDEIVHIEPGVFARCRGVWTGDVLVASAVILGHPGPDAVVGTVFDVSLPERQLLVDGVTVQVTPSTEIHDCLNRPISMERFLLGARAAAQGQWNGEVLVARDLRLCDRLGDDDPRRTEFSGQVRSIDRPTRSFVVHDFLVTTDEFTEFRLPDGTMTNFGTLNVGDWVHVVGMIQPDRSVHAGLVIIRDHDEEPPDVVHAHGTVRAVDLERSVLVVQGRAFHVTDDTIILGCNAVHLTLADVHVGDYVVVIGVIRPSGEIVAQLIVDLTCGDPGEPRPVRFVGSVQAIPDEHTIVVAHRVVHVTPSTELVSYGGVPMELGDLSIGDPVAVIGVRIPDRGIVARAILREVALISAINTEVPAIRVHDQWVAVPPSAEILFGEGVSGEFGDLAVGQTIRLHAGERGDVIVARRIQVRSELHLALFGDGEEPVTLEFIDGLPSVMVTREEPGGGFVFTRNGASSAHPGTIACLRMVISSDQEEASAVPPFRVRVGSNTFHHTGLIRVNPVGSMSITATPEAKVYRAYLAPPRDAHGRPEPLNGLFVSFDTFDFDIQPGEPPVTFTIHAIDLEIIPADEVVPGELLASFDFDNSTDGWFTENSAVSSFTAPTVDSNDGALGLGVVDENTYGTWMTEVTGLSVSPGATLRMRARIRSDSDDTSRLPVVRMRMHDEAFEQIGMIVLQSNGPSISLPAVQGQIYDLYYRWPRVAPTLETLLLEFDIYNFDSRGHPGREVELESITLEAVHLPN